MIFRIHTGEHTGLAQEGFSRGAPTRYRRCPQIPYSVFRIPHYDTMAQPPEVPFSSTAAG